MFVDVVKTRLQVEARAGQTNYKGVRDAFSKICASMYFKREDPGSTDLAEQTRRKGFGHSSKVAPLGY